MPKLNNQWFEHATGNVVGFFCLKQGGWQWVIVQKETCTRWVVAEVVDLTIGININGVFVDMHATNAIRGVVGIEEGEKMLAIEVE